MTNPGGNSSSTANWSPTNFSRLDSQRLAHNRATLAEQLQLGDGATAWGGLGTGRGGQSAESGGGGLLQEGAHGLRLAKDSVHGERGQRRSTRKSNLVLPIDWGKTLGKKKEGSMGGRRRRKYDLCTKCFRAVSNCTCYCTCTCLGYGGV